MKKAILFVITLILISCGKTKEQPNAKANDTTAPIAAFLTNTDALKDEGITEKKPIQSFVTYAEANADKTIKLTKDNIDTHLADATNYKHCVIVVGNHTIVKILDFKDCKQSRSWGACMPLAEGYIKKGGLQSKKDHINNIIGLPDNQVRMMYLFN